MRGRVDTLDKLDGSVRRAPMPRSSGETACREMLSQLVLDSEVRGAVLTVGVIGLADVGTALATASIKKKKVRCILKKRKAA